MLMRFSVVIACLNFKILHKREKCTGRPNLRDSGIRLWLSEIAPMMMSFGRHAGERIVNGAKKS